MRQLWSFFWEDNAPRQNMAVTSQLGESSTTYLQSHTIITPNCPFNDVFFISFCHLVGIWSSKVNWPLKGTLKLSELDLRPCLDLPSSSWWLILKSFHLLPLMRLFFLCPCLRLLLGVYYLSLLCLSYDPRVFVVKTLCSSAPACLLSTSHLSVVSSILFA